MSEKSTDNGVGFGGSNSAAGGTGAGTGQGDQPAVAPPDPDATITGAAIGPAPLLSAEQWAAANPFPGLRAFKPGEGDRFFGRQQQIDDLVLRLAGTPFVAVSGASGCGKSSLVLAGLLNELQRRQTAANLRAADNTADGAGGPTTNLTTKPATGLATQWRPAVLRPGNRPIAHLAQALAVALRPGDAAPSQHKAGDDPAGDDAAQQADDQRRAESLNGRLRLGGLGLVEAVRQARLTPNVRVLVVVDQFEEIFRFKRQVSTDEAGAFVKLLLQAAADPGSPVSVVITLRSDTLGACADFPDLAESVSRGGYLVPRLKRDQRKQAIVNPVRLRGAQIAPRLVQRLLNDVSDDFDDLPVMQHALSRTWAHWAANGAGSRPIDLVDYDAVGGAAEALSRHADEAAASLGALGQADPQGLPGLVERVFRALTERSAEANDTRRPLAFDELCAVCGAPASDVAQVVDRYRRPDTALLQPSLSVPLADNPVVDISHESLIRLWTQLKRWVATEAAARSELLRLLDDADRHELVLHGRAASPGVLTPEGLSPQPGSQAELLRDAGLARALQWQRLNQPNAAWVALTTGGDGVAPWQQVQRLLQASLARQTDQIRRSRQQRLVKWLTGTVLALSLLTTVVVAYNRGSLQQQSQSRELVNRALLDTGQDPARGATLALAAVNADASNGPAVQALRQAISQLDIAQADAIVELSAPVTDARYDGAMKRLVVAAGREVVILDATTLARQVSVPVPANVLRAWLVGDLVMSFADDWKVRLQDQRGQLLADLSCTGTRTNSSNTAYTAAASPAQANQPAQLAVGCYNGELTLWQIGPAGVLGRQPLAKGDDEGSATVTALAFSNDGQWLAAGDNAGLTRVWQRGKPERPWIGSAPPGLSPIRHDGAVRDLAFHPAEPGLLASASDDRTSRVWSLDLITGRLMADSAADKAQHRLPNERPVLRARFVQRADDAYRLMTVADKRIYFWTDDNTRDELRHDDWVTEANVSADGELVASGSSDGTARVWSTRSAAPIAVLRGHRNEVTHALFGPQGEVITTSTDRTLRRWRIQPPQLLVAQKHWLHSALVEPGGRWVVVCGERGILPGAAGANCQQVMLDGRGAMSARQPLEGVKADAVQDLSLSPDGRWLLGHRTSQDVYRSTRPVAWDMASRRETTPGWLNAWQAATFNGGQAELLTVNDSGQIALWPLAALTEANPKSAAQFNAKTALGARALSLDGRWLAAADGRRILLWDRRAGAGAATPTSTPTSTPTGAPTSTPASSPAGSVANAEPQVLQDHAGDVRSLAFSRDSRQLLSASADRSARIWPLPAADQPASARGPSRELAGGHSAALWSAAFSPDGQRVVTGSADNTVRVWDASTGQPLATLSRHQDAVNAVSFSPDGQQLLSASDDGTLQLGPCPACTAPLDRLRQQAAAVVLPAAERAAITADSQRRLGTPLPDWLGRLLGR